MTILWAACRGSRVWEAWEAWGVWEVWEVWGVWEISTSQSWAEEWVTWEAWVVVMTMMYASTVLSFPPHLLTIAPG